jgi:hypothetical protein
MMGKHANERAYAEFERRERRAQDESFEPAEPLSEAEKAAQWDRAYWDGLDSDVTIARGGK